MAHLENEAAEKSAPFTSPLLQIAIFIPKKKDQKNAGRSASKLPLKKTHPVFHVKGDNQKANEKKHDQEAQWHVAKTARQSPAAALKDIQRLGSL